MIVIRAIVVRAIVVRGIGGSSASSLIGWLLGLIAGIVATKMLLTPTKGISVAITTCGDTAGDDTDATTSVPSSGPENVAKEMAADGVDAPIADMFPVVGLGASAGGLDAFRQFLRAMPADSGMAFVLVQHLDPHHASLLSSILAQCTTMPVTEAYDRQIILPNHVYVMPPNCTLAIADGALRLGPVAETHALRMPIDHFFQSLAEDRGTQAVGIVLSGTGSDGTLGLHAILKRGGRTIVQEPATAAFDGMPASAILAGDVSQVLAVERMPDALLRGVSAAAAQPAFLRSLRATRALKRILALLRSGTGHDFSEYKKSTLSRRIERRMAQHGIDDPEAFASYLERDQTELQQLFNELLINVTAFFRDPEVFDVLEKDILPPLLAAKPAGYAFRVWVAGGSTGKEAYSIAMLLHEWITANHRHLTVQIYSTDLDEVAISRARAAVYPTTIAEQLRPDRLQNFFVKIPGGYRIKKEIRDMVVFATQDIIMDPPFTRLDLISCRNLMIYLEPSLQDRLINTFHYALKPEGVLVLSPSESIGDHDALFVPLNRRWRIYRALPSVASVASVRAVLTRHQLPMLTLPAKKIDKKPEPPMIKAKDANFAELAGRALLQSFAPAAVLTDAAGNILFVHGETGKYLRPAPGEATLNVIEMAYSGLQSALRAAFSDLASQQLPLVNREVSMGFDGGFDGGHYGGFGAVSLSVRPLPDRRDGENLALVSFQEVVGAASSQPSNRTLGGRLLKGLAKSTKAGGKERSAGASIEQQRIAELERDLVLAKANLNAAVEDQQASNEELQSTNEELQSTNEELQSTNEELQSVNEELVIVNNELQEKVEQMTVMQNDMKNLLDNVNSGIIFLDTRSVIRRFTRGATRIYRLVDSDVGRPLGDINSQLRGENILADAQAVLDSLVPVERELRGEDGSWCLVRLQPYRTVDNVIDGVVLTFTDISQRIEALAEQRKARQLAESIIDTVREPLIVLNGALQVVSASRAFYREFRITPEATVGRPIYELSDHQWDIAELRTLLETILPRDQSFEGYEVDHEFPNIGRRQLLLNARRIVNADQQPQLILLTIEVAHGN